MAFGKEKCQNDAEYKLQPNNYCGGFAMSAILTDFQEKDTDPMTVYSEIQNSQKTVSPTLQGLIESERLNGTDICLPSSLVKMSRKAGFVAKLKYSELLQFSAAAIEEEVNRCGVETVEQVKSEDSLKQFSDTSVKYYLVLVNICHWIAVKRKTKGDGFSVYDSETGENKKFDNAQTMLQDWTASYKNAGAVIITLQK